MTRDRDVRVPKEKPLTSAEGAPVQPWHEEPTGVHTDTQVFRGLKALGAELEESKRIAALAHGALKQEVTDLAKHVDGRLNKQDLMLERISGQMDVLVPMKRARSSSSETKAIVDEALAKSGTKFRRELILKIVGGVFSAGVLGAVIHWLAS